jgi:hypothetical protein
MFFFAKIFSSTKEYGFLLNFKNIFNLCLEKNYKKYIVLKSCQRFFRKYGAVLRESQVFF